MFPMIMACIIISVSYWTFCTYIVGEWEWTYSLKGWVNIIFLNINFFLLCYSYYLAIVSNPGYDVGTRIYPPPQHGGVQQVNIQQENVLVDPISEYYMMKYCKNCEVLRNNIRTHHCSVCKKCVIKMDHHCPFVYNCVGFKNQKFFILFLFYATVSLFYFLTCMAIKFYYKLTIVVPTRPSFRTYDIILFIIHGIITTPVTIAILILLLDQLRNLKTNLTIIERYKQSSLKIVSKDYGINDWRWFHDYGFKNNFKEIMGDKYYEWFIPVLPKHLRVENYEFKTRDYHVKLDNYVQENIQKNPKRRVNIILKNC
jgi:hypothetical protein